MPTCVTFVTEEHFVVVKGGCGIPGTGCPRGGTVTGVGRRGYGCRRG